jgi:hypothetical protein
MEVKILSTNNSKMLYGALKEMHRNSLSGEVVYAVQHNDAKTSFNLSMQKIMQSTDGVLLLFEDDIEIRDFSHFEEAVSQLPNDWELCYLGANLIAPIEKYSENLYKTFGAWTTHAVMYNNPKELCKEYIDTNIMFDDWLKTNIHPRGNTYIIKPMIAWQKPHDSDLWNHFADYTRIFDDSAAKLI